MMRRVSLIGFQGSRTKNFRRHAELYRRILGNDVEIDVVCPGYLENYDMSTAQELADRMRKKWDRSLLHVFSGGCYPASVALTDVILENRLEESISGIVWESSPVDCSTCTAVRALCTHFTTATGIPMPKSVARSVVEMHNTYVRLPMDAWCERFDRSLRARALERVPTLAITCGRDDTIEEPRAFAAERSSWIDEAYFPNAKHCRAILDDPEKYANCLRYFVLGEDRVSVEERPCCPVSTSSVLAEDGPAMCPKSDVCAHRKSRASSST